MNAEDRHMPQEPHDTRHDFGEFATQLGLSSDELLDKLKSYNQALDGGKGLSERAIEMMRKDGISLRRRLTRDWLAGFVRTSRSTTNDHSFAETADLIKELGSAGANVSAVNVGPSDLVFEDVQSFGVAVTEYQTKNLAVEDARAILSGHYIVARETTHQDEFHYYEEPVYIGTSDQQSWMLTERHGVAKGFVVPSNGIMTLVLSHSHSVRGTGTITLMVGLGDDDDVDYHAGLMLRLSDTQARPTASRIVLRKADDHDQISAWEEVVSATEKVKSKHVRKLIKRLEDGDPLQEAFRGLETGVSLKTPELTKWPGMLRQVGLVSDED